MLTINIDIARRFILGKQGLWPGRRWRGIEGTAQAMRAMEYVQLDPLQIIARSQDIKLHSRVLDYTPGLWEEVAYQQRQFFDWGGWLAVRPMDELPHWRVVMHREREHDTRLRSSARDHADAIVEMRAILHERGTVSNRDFAMATRTRTQSYRGRKDSALALYYSASTTSGKSTSRSTNGSLATTRCPFYGATDLSRASTANSTAQPTPSSFWAYGWRMRRLAPMLPLQKH